MSWNYHFFKYLSEHMRCKHKLLLASVEERFYRWLRSATALICLLSAGSVTPAVAQNVWTGNTSAALNVSGNYQAGASVAADGNSSGTFVFGRVSSSRRALTISSEFKVNRMQFESNGGGTFSLSGSFLNFIGGSNGIFTSSSLATTISSGIKVSDGPLTLGGDGTGLVTLSGSSGNDYGGKGVTKSGTSAFLITQSISNPGTVTISGGTLAFSGSGNLASAYQLRGGVIAASGTFSRTVGTGQTSVNFAAGSNGGFAAYGGALTVSTNLGTWGTTASSLTATSNLILGSNIADNVVTLSAALNVGAAARTIQLVNNANSANDSAAISGIISGTGGLNLTGAGNLALSGVNTYTGVTTIGSGVTLSVGTIGDGGVAGNLGQAARTAANLVLSGGTLRYTGATASTDRNFTLSAGTTSAIHVSTAATVLTMTGASATTTGSINKTGDGVLTLSAANTHTGGTILTAGTLRATTNAGALGNGTLTLSGGILDLVNDTGLAFGRNTTVTANTQINSRRTNAGAGVTHSLGTLAIGAQTLTTGTDATVNSGTAGVTFGATTLSASGTTFTANAGTLLTLGTITGTNTGFTVNGAGNTTIGGAIGTGNGTLNKAGAGLLTLSAANLYTGATSVTDGTLAVANAAGLGTIAGGTTVSSGAALRIENVAIGAEALILNGTGIGGTGALTATGTSSTSGTVSLATNSTVGVAAGADSLTLSGAVSGSGALTKVGAGTLTLSGTNTYTSATNVNAGNLILSGGSAIANTGAVVLADVSGANLQINASETIGSLAGGGITGGNVNLQGNTLTTGDASSTTFAGVISGSGGSVIKTGAGTLTFTRANTYSGKTTIANGTLSIASIDAVASNAQPLGKNAALDLGVAATSSGRLLYTGAATTLSKDINALGNGTDTIQNAGSGLLTLSGTLTMAGTTLNLVGGASGIRVTSTITGLPAGSDLVIGNGTTTLQNENTYTGTTTVSGGTLLVNNTTGSGTGTGDVTVSNSSTILGGSGTVAGNLTVNAGALIAPGSAASTAGTLTIGGSTVVIAGNGVAETRVTFDYTNATGNVPGLTSATWSSYNGALLTGNGGQNNDLLKFTPVTTSLSWNTGGKISLNQIGSAYSWSQGDVFNLLDWTSLSGGAIGGSFNSAIDFNLPTLSGGLAWDTSRFVTTGAIAVVPEPGRALLMLFGLIALFLRRRRQD